MRTHLENARDLDAGDLGARRIERFDFETEPVERFRDRARVGFEGNEVV